MTQTSEAACADGSKARVHIGLLEDDPIIVEVLASAFAEAGWSYHHSQSIEQFMQALSQQPFDLLLLDWSLPDGDSDQVIRYVREEVSKRLPIIIESVDSDESKIVQALQLGADDYVTKPLRLNEVQARINAHLRTHKSNVKKTLEVHPFFLDIGSGQIFLEQREVPLTVMEFSLINYFFDHPNVLLSRQQLLSEVWHSHPELDTRTVDAHVCRLRKKLDLGEKTGWQINTLRGFGYRLETC